MVFLGLMTVGLLAKRANISVRTLQHYDNIGLLKPSSFSAAGRRLYTVNDMTILHQIITLKNLGLSLADIKNRLMPINSNEDIKRMLLRQAHLIREQVLRADKVIESIEMITAEIDMYSVVDWSKYSHMMKLIQDNNESFWVMNYIEKDVLENIAHVHEQFSEEELPSDWLVKCMKKANVLLHSGCTPTSDEAQILAAEMWRMVEKYTSGQPAMVQKLYFFFKEAKYWPKQYAEMQKNTHEFLEESIEHYLKIVKQRSLYQLQPADA